MLVHRRLLQRHVNNPFYPQIITEFLTIFLFGMRPRRCSEGKHFRIVRPCFGA
jgi:hypothetical protein